MCAWRRQYHRWRQKQEDSWWRISSWGNQLSHRNVWREKHRCSMQPWFLVRTWELPTRQMCILDLLTGCTPYSVSSAPLWDSCKSEWWTRKLGEYSLKCRRRMVHNSLFLLEQPGPSRWYSAHNWQNIRGHRGEQELLSLKLRGRSSSWEEAGCCSMPSN